MLTGPTVYLGFDRFDAVCRASEIPDIHKDSDPEASNHSHHAEPEPPRTPSDLLLQEPSESGQPDGGNLKTETCSRHQFSAQCSVLTQQNLYPVFLSEVGQGEQPVGSGDEI